MGHVIPLLHLAHWAAQSGIKATFLASDVPLKRAPSLMHLNLTLVALPSTGVTYEDYAQGPHAVMPLYQQMIGPASAELERLAAEGATAVVASPFIFFGSPVAKRLGMHWTTLVDVSPIGAAVTLRVAAAAVGQEPEEQLCPDGLDVPGYMRVGTEDVIAVFGEKGLTPSGPTVWLASGFAQLVQESDAMLANAIPGLDDLSEAELGSRIGPLFLHSPSDLPADIASFLDKQQPRSVVYIAFGTLSVRDDALLEQIHNVLEEIGVPFIWITNAELDPLPNGIVQRWLPQAAVLQHPSIGLFYSHGGWNSVLEAVAGGVPILLKPAHAEQWLNARVVEEKYGTGRKGCPESIKHWARGGWAKETANAAVLAEKVTQSQAQSQASWDKWVEAAFKQ